MTERRPVVVVNGALEELPTMDIMPVATASKAGSVYPDGDTLSVGADGEINADPAILTLKKLSFALTFLG